MDQVKQEKDWMVVVTYLLKYRQEPVMVGVLDGTLAPNKEETTPMPAHRIALSGMLLNVLNPKLSLFFMAFLPQFVPVGPGSTATMMGLAAIFMALTFVVFVLYGACASLARNYVISQPSVMRWCRRAFAGSFGLLGLKLALAER